MESDNNNIDNNNNSLKRKELEIVNNNENVSENVNKDLEVEDEEKEGDDNDENDNYYEYLKLWNGRKRSRTNELMHRDNIYKNNPPNFKLLAEKYPKFDKFILNKNEKIYNIDWKDPDAVRELTITLLDHDFGLKVNLPFDYLCPMITSRLNYLLWIKDCYDRLAEQCFPLPKDSSDGNVSSRVSQSRSSVRAIDVGTGASCIYPLLGTRLFGWRFLATDIDSRSIEFARSNVERNQLQREIQVIQVEKELILNNVIDEYSRYEISICNPPFFEDLKQTKLNHKTTCTGADNELVTEGGELQFVKRMIKDSLILRSNIKLYSTLLGRKKNVESVLTMLRDNNINCYTTTELAQGNCSRWVVCWSFVGDELTFQKPEELTRKQRRAIERPGFKGTFVTNLPLTHVILELGMYLKLIDIKYETKEEQQQQPVQSNQNLVDNDNNISSNDDNNNNNNNNDNDNDRHNSTRKIYNNTVVLDHKKYILNYDCDLSFNFTIEMMSIDFDKFTVEIRVDLRDKTFTDDDNQIIKKQFKYIANQIHSILMHPGQSHYQK
ncbi:hypothetical protein PPL_05710 [Heterostelium album PN500]|uniref:U6 small nuclear RNA (adenine-(43)-N(6))-methyltransferase n=1 Tax=Heterostelium pallidum (strain ATCC 26659 / Pp 5 / PN500) TaxID=670386 RepID=D3BAX9_HETP5|nr:hypothetical protein PPL_05710 [Heterostelium album PN500]EFA81716.1 hypothetical protein PPL_05710 [Heterostelium album PN500]|eukprot:XP_020433833.1 hypothetical protein PPL_05710 [Heterostelium album PN500]